MIARKRDSPASTGVGCLNQSGTRCSICGPLSKRYIVAVDACVSDWLADTSRGRAESFDRLHPDCECEKHSFCGNATALATTEIVARIITTPGTFDETAQEIIWSKLVRLYTDGLSMFRSGCTEAEVREAVRRLTTTGAEPQQLFGVALASVGTIRAAGSPERWFCVYDTEASEFSAHADVIGRWPQAVSKNQRAKLRESRTRNLRNRLGRWIVRASTAGELIDSLQGQGFVVLP